MLDSLLSKWLALYVTFKLCQKIHSIRFLKILNSIFCVKTPSSALLINTIKHIPNGKNVPSSI